MSASPSRVSFAVGLTLLLATAASAQEPGHEPASQPDAVSSTVQPPALEWRLPMAGVAAVDPDKAFSRALLGPGLGHFYCGESTRGALLLGGAGASIVVGFLLSGNGKYNPDEHKYNRGREPVAYGLAGAGVLYIASLIDSRASCNRVNQRP
jgi:hypothetical protein